jgi:hypothetical protein
MELCLGLNRAFSSNEVARELRGLGEFRVKTADAGHFAGLVGNYPGYSASPVSIKPAIVPIMCIEV